jgi:sugar phosphate isomerase/epimerase
MIGVSTKSIKIGRFWLESLVENGFKVIELNNRTIQIKFGDEDIKKLNEKKEKYNLKYTIHSEVTDLLHPDKLVTDHQLGILKSEIKYGPRFGVKNIVFHLPDYLDFEKDKKRIEKLFSEILEFAEKYNVQLSLENDSKGVWAKPNNLLYFFERFEDLKHNLDVGHLHKAVYHKLVSSEDDYVKKLGKYVNYIHVDDNHGLDDEHLGLGSGTIDIDFVVSVIKKLNPEVIIAESPDINEAIKTREVLKKYGV